MAGLILIGLVMLTVVSGTAPATAQSVFYVDNQSASCSNAGPGTEAQPYCTISAAATAHKGPGITIVVKPGIYREQVTIPTSGSGVAGSPFVIRAQGPGVLVDGSDSFANPASWSAFSGDVWLASSVTWTPKQVYVDGARLEPYTGDPSLLPVNSFLWDSGQGLYVNLGGDNPGIHETLVGRRNHGFNMFTKSWVTIDGFAISHTEDRGINIQTGCTDIVISNNTVSFANSYGIQSVAGVNIVIEGNVVSDCNLHGIGLISGATGCTIRDNESFRNAHPTVRQANGIYLYGSPGNTLSGNRLHHNQDTGLQLSPGSNNCVSYNNVSWSNGDHGYDHLYTSGTINVNNVAYGNYRHGFSMQADGPGTRLHNCIAVENGVTTSSFNLYVEVGSVPGFVSDHNLIWNSTSQNPIKYNNVQYTTIAAYSAASGQDAHSIQADPLFVNPGAGDFHLQSGSPAIDSGDSGVPNWPATDAENNARVDVPAVPNTGLGLTPYGDRGALEYQLGAAPVAALAVIPASGPPPLLVTADASASFDPNGSVVSYTFDFGDGTVAGPQVSPTANHTFGVGDWTVTVTVTDNDGLTATASQGVSVVPILIAALTVTPATGNAPLLVAADASGSDAGGQTIVSYTFNFGDGTTAGPQTAPSASHTYLPGFWTASVTIENDLGHTASASVPVIVAETGPGPNLCGNPSFETGTAGWETWGSAIMTRVPGGFDGPTTLRVTGPARTAPFGIADSPDWIGSTAAAGTRYRFRAWVRSAAAGGTVRIRVREYNQRGRALSPWNQSVPTTLSPTWQLLTLDHVCRAAGSTLDFRFLDGPIAPREVVDIDNISIHVVPGTSTNVVLGTSAEDVPISGPEGFAPSVSPNPVRDRGSIRFATSRPGPLRVQIFDVTGRVVRTLADESDAPAAQYELPLEGRGHHGAALGSGMYFYRVETLEGTATGRFLVVR